MRTLIVKLGAIGDVVMLIPAAHALHAAGHTIDWAVGAAVAPVLGCYPWINVLPVDDRAMLQGSAPARLRAIAALWREIWRLSAGQRYDQVATFYYDRRYRVLAAPIRARRRIVLSTTDRRFQLLPGRHHTDEYARILLDAPDSYRPVQLAPVLAERLGPSPVPRTAAARVVLAPAGARNMLRDDVLRRWPVTQYVQLARLLLQRGVEVVLVGGPDDARVRPEFAGLPVTDRIGQLSLPETLSLLDAADVMVTHDTGPLHLAGITRVSIVSLFGPTDPRGRLPQRPGTLALWGGEHFSCRPCYDGRSYAPCPRNLCIEQVSPERVLDEVLAMLRARADGRLDAPRVAPV